MTEASAQLDLVFQALSDPTRRRMLMTLREGDRSVAELAQPFRMSLPGASKHIKVLENANLLSRQKRGRSHICSLNREAFEVAEAWIEMFREFWNSRLDKLAEELTNRTVRRDE